MKKTILLLAFIGLGLTSCKKEECLTHAQLKEELNNNNDSDFTNWSDLVNNSWYNDSLGSNYFGFNDSQKLLYFSTNKVDYEWRSNHHEIIVSFDSTALNSIGSMFDNYLKDLLNKGFQNDVLELLSIKNRKALLYSRELKYYINLNKI